MPWLNYKLIYLLMSANIYISSYCTRVLDNDVELLAKALDIISSHRDEHQIEVTI